MMSGMGVGGEGVGGGVGMAGRYMGLREKKKNRARACVFVSVYARAYLCMPLHEYVFV